MQVILLAAGRSTRLDPLSDKNLLEFCGKPLIVHQVEALKKAGLKDISVVAGKHNLAAMGALFAKEKSIRVTEQKRLEDGQAGGVLAGYEALQKTPAKGKKVLVMSTNDVFEPSLFRVVLKTAAQKQTDAVLAAKKVSEYFPGGYLKLNRGLVTEVVEKPKEGKEPSDLVNLVCHAFNDFPSFAQTLRSAKSKKDDLYEVALSAYIQGGAHIRPAQYNGFWQAIKYPWHVLLLMNHFLATQKRSVHKSADIAKSAVIKGNVVIEKGVRVLENAVIQGPAYLGEGCIVANNALVRGSMVGKNCVVGYTTEIARSYLSADVWTHTNYVGDSVIDSNVSFGSGGVTGNLRFDEGEVRMNIKGERIGSGLCKLGAVVGSGARFGINVSINPGIKVGRDCFVGPGVLLDRDLDDGKMITAKQVTKITDNHHKIHMDDRAAFRKKLGK